MERVMKMTIGKKEFKDMRSWLDFLYYELGGQRKLEVCGLRKQEDKRISTKWKNYLDVISKVKDRDDVPFWVNQRSILSNEIILDLEEQEEYENIIQTIKKAGLYFISWFTGSRGYHISLFFDTDLESIVKQRLIEKMGCDPSKSADRTMIALEFREHWKSGKPKRVVDFKLFDESGNIGANTLNIGTIMLNDKEYEEFILTKSIKTLGYK